ncbi:O-methyltransferase [bacterium]|nr:O-methyltransferase [bacterium]
MNDTEKYIRNFITRPISIMTQLESKNSVRNDIQPPIEPEIGQLLAFLIRSYHAKTVLEIGTGNGYSTLWLQSALPPDGHITTIDSKRRLHDEAVKTFTESGTINQITALFGEAEKLIPALAQNKPESFDFIFQDAGKYLYPQLLDATVALLKPGGIIVADDTLFKVNDTIRENLGKHTHQYNEVVFADRRLFSTIVPIGHGLTLSLKVKP